MWRDSDEPTQAPQTATLDVVFRIDCASLPVDHAAALAQAVCTHTPLLAASPVAGVHAIHVAGSQNGWERPRHNGEGLLLSRRTRLRVRVEAAHASALIDQLSGVTLDVSGHILRILSATMRALTPVPTLFSRYTVFKDLDLACEEDVFVQRVIKHCGLLGFSPTKVMCGKTQDLASSDGIIRARSVLLADVPAHNSVTLQDQGLGDYRTMGCGLLIPHKDTGAVDQH